MSNICKAGTFSDGGKRFVIVENGYACDPLPSDPTKIVFNSDWPEVFQLGSGYIGSVAVPAYNVGGGAASASWPALDFAPSVTVGIGPSALGTLSSAVYAVSLLGGPWTAGAAITGTGFSLVNPGAAYNMLWGALLFNPAGVIPAGTSRAGTNWMKWSVSGPVVARPGKDCSSTNPDDFLIPPSSFGRTLVGPVLAQAVTSLPYYANLGGGNYEYVGVYPHNLGFVPVTIVSASSPVIGSYLAPASVYIDTTNVYVWYESPTNASSISIGALSFFVSNYRWV